MVSALWITAAVPAAPPVYTTPGGADTAPAVSTPPAAAGRPDPSPLWREFPLGTPRRKGAPKTGGTQTPPADGSTAPAGRSAPTSTTAPGAGGDDSGPSWLLLLALGTLLVMVGVLGFLFSRRRAERRRGESGTERVGPALHGPQPRRPAVADAAGPVRTGRPRRRSEPLRAARQPNGTPLQSNGGPPEPVSPRESEGASNGGAPASSPWRPADADGDPPFPESGSSSFGQGGSPTGAASTPQTTSAPRPAEQDTPTSGFPPVSEDAAPLTRALPATPATPAAEPNSPGHQDTPPSGFPPVERDAGQARDARPKPALRWEAKSLGRAEAEQPPLPAPDAVPWRPPEAAPQPERSSGTPPEERPRPAVAGRPRDPRNLWRRARSR